MKITTEVLSVLSLSTTEGTLLRLPPGQLDRKLYVATDKVLQACGGKWNKSKKAHVFDSDARERIDVILATGSVTTAREIGFFPTPETLADNLVNLADVTADDEVLEPSAGTGAIVRALQDVGALVTAVEWDAGRRDVLVRDVLKSHDSLFRIIGESQHDFMECGFSKPFDRVVMNPPFTRVGKGDHLDHVRHAFSMLRKDGVLVSVLPSSVTFREDKRHAEFRDWVLDHGTVEDLPEGSFRESGTDVNTCVARMVKS